MNVSTGERKQGRFRLWVVAGGKGGTGKSVVSSGLACALSHMGNKVVLVDADLGGANLHTFLDLPRPNLTLEDLLTRDDVDLGDVLKPGPMSGLQVILGADGTGDGQDYSPELSRRLLSALDQVDAKHVVIDLGAGSSPFQLLLFNGAELPVLVINPEPTSVENAYTFLKLAVIEKVKSVVGDLDVSNLLKESQGSMGKMIKNLPGKDQKTPPGPG